MDFNLPYKHNTLLVSQKSKLIHFPELYGMSNTQIHC